MSVAILHSMLSFKHLLSKSFSALTLCNDIIQQFKSQQAPCPCAKCPVHTTQALHCTRLLSNTSQLHYIAHYTVRPVCCLRHVFRHMVANRKQQLLLSSNRNIKITVTAVVNLLPVMSNCRPTHSLTEELTDRVINRQLPGCRTRRMNTDGKWTTEFKQWRL